MQMVVEMVVEMVVVVVMVMVMANKVKNEIGKEEAIVVNEEVATPTDETTLASLTQFL